MTVVVDTSVLLRWFHAEGETEVAESRAILAAHLRHRLRAYLLDLTFYELGNILTRSLRWSAVDVADQLDTLVVICGAAAHTRPGLAPIHRDAGRHTRSDLL
ncbi:MAG TPA: PIN domain-containing protein [Mycobacteriales bacterium]|nr:PIN domain-containing protein [Mycobacteriales bacterium]